MVVREGIYNTLTNLSHRLENRESAAQHGLQATRLRRGGQRREVLKFNRVKAAVGAKTPCA